MTEFDLALARLHIEYEAGGETFLTRLRLDVEWDPAAFTRLTDALRPARRSEGRATVGRGTLLVCAHLHPHMDEPRVLEIGHRC